MKNIFLALLLFGYAGTLTASQDRDFITARNVFQAGNSTRLAAIAPRLKGHVLESYVAYYQLSLQLGNSNVDANAVRRFLSRYQGSLLANRIRGEWLKILGETHQWELFAEEYPALVEEDTELSCYSLQQRLYINDSDALHDALPLWFNGQDMPESCAPLFDSLVAAELLTEEDVWWRIRLALEAGNVGVVKHINQYLPKKEALNERELDAATENPLRYLERHRENIKTHADREVALFAMLRLLRSGLDRAHAFWPKVLNQFSNSEHSYFKAQLASRAAYMHDPRALDWFMEAANTGAPVLLSDAQLVWKTRAALRAGDWMTVLESIEAMSTLEQHAAAWQYWKARALMANGRTAKARAIFAPLSTEHHFYGQLAEEELGVVMGALPKSHKINTEEIAAIQQLPGIQRALALYHLNLRIEAMREWVWAIRKFDDKHLLAAAEIARRNKIYDRAINTANKTVQLHDFSLRYLAPHREVMKKVLKQEELDEALVYGLIRQESRFITDAKSSSGAIGLMQLMPTTARWVAKKSGMRNYRQGLVSQVNTNLVLGTYYLKHVLTLFDNQSLLASAAYNAGPSRAQKWRGVESLEGAIYAETIPFNETRDYVQKVMSNSMYYASTFGHQMRSLKERLDIVEPKSEKLQPVTNKKNRNH
ncbi:MAG: transglycosylase [Nitrosomonadales bacterium]|jgi:soluble lytic murein transglycosylase|nr:MAG: transglycosylase [Nitrosomonadales bacterium]